MPTPPLPRDCTITHTLQLLQQDHHLTGPSHPPVRPPPPPLQRRTAWGSGTSGSSPESITRAGLALRPVCLQSQYKFPTLPRGLGRDLKRKQAKEAPLPRDTRVPHDAGITIVSCPEGNERDRKQARCDLLSCWRHSFQRNVRFAESMCSEALGSQGRPVVPTLHTRGRRN